MVEYCYGGDDQLMRRTHDNTCILPIVLYASECWAPTKADVARLDAFDQWCLRRILGITWQEHITSVEVREGTGLPAVSETIISLTPC